MFPISLAQVLLAVSTKAKLFSLITITPLVCCSFLANSVKVLAQPTPDNTLPNNTRVLPNGNLIDIKGGTRPQNGANLFHSFENFSVESNKTVRFIHNSGIENIINRVTGGSISNINGTIQTLIDVTKNKGNANIFIINPNGIIFGANAKLDIGGSFFASTADSIKFADGSFYSALNPQETPLLTINVPLGLQFNNSNSGDIVVQGNGNNLFFDENTFATVRDNRPVGLQVQSGKTLALVGGNVNLEGGNLTAEQGRVELGSVQGQGLVTLNSTTSNSTTSDWNLDYTQVSNFQDINLTSAASIDASGNGGEVQVIGRNISLVDGSAILSKTTGDSIGGTLNIKATDTLEVLGFSFDLPFSTSILTDVDFGSSGDAGKIVIETKNLIVADGGQITSSTSGKGNGGIVDVTAENIQLTFGGFFGPSGIFADANFSTGNGGSIFVKTDNLLIEEGAAIAGRTFSEGKAGNLDITAKDIQLVGTAFVTNPSTLSTSSSSPTGNGGNIKVKTDTLKIVDGAQIQASTPGSGNAGTLDIQAKQIEISGASMVDASTIGLLSGIFAIVEEDSSGNGGFIGITTESLQLLDGGQIVTSAFGSGNGGTLEIKSNDIAMAGFAIDSPSALFSDADRGQGGNVNIETNNLSLIGGAQIAAFTSGQGEAGNLNIKAKEINLDGFTAFGRTGLFTTAVIGTGNGGRLSVETDKLTIRDGATISASNFSSRNPNTNPGKGRAGDIEINARILELDSNNPQEPASITASTFAGGGGNITLNVNEISARNSSQITSETKGSGDGGNLNINSQNFNLSNSALVSTSSQGSGDAGTINIDGDKINIFSNSQISTDSIGSGEAGDIKILFERLESNQGKITARSVQTGGGKITLTATASEIFLRNNSLISTNVLDGSGGGGDININADIIAAFENSDITANAVEGNGGNINITTQGLFGLAFREQPTAESSDITASSEFGLNGTVEINDFGIDPTSGLVELPTQVSDPSKQIATRCSTKDSNSFVVTGRGGIPHNPSQPLHFNSTWLDLRDWSVSSKKNNHISQKRQISNKPEIVEATGFIRNEKGEIEFVALENTPLINQQSCNI